MQTVLEGTQVYEEGITKSVFFLLERFNEKGLKTEPVADSLIDKNVLKH